MKVMGIRVGPQRTRVAIVGPIESEPVLLMSADESRLTYPANCTEVEDKMLWLFREMERLHHEHPDISRVAIKTNEYTQTDSKAKRETAYLEAATMLFWKQQSIAVVRYIYSSMATKSTQVRDHAASRMGKTEKYWDNQMADAVVAAWREGGS